MGIDQAIDYVIFCLHGSRSQVTAVYTLHMVQMTLPTKLRRLYLTRNWRLFSLLLASVFQSCFEQEQCSSVYEWEWGCSSRQLPFTMGVSKAAIFSFQKRAAPLFYSLFVKDVWIGLSIWQQSANQPTWGLIAQPNKQGVRQKGSRGSRELVIINLASKS